MLDSLIARFGLLAIVLGSALEGEPFSIAGGILAHQRLVPLWGTMASAIGGAWLIDQFWFFVGRSFRSHSRIEALTRRPGFSRSLALFERNPRRFIFFFRFAYGLRIVAPLAIGTTRVSPFQYLRVSAAAAIVWGSAYSLVGFLFGRTIAPWVGHNAPIMLVIGATLVIAPMILLSYRRPATVEQE